MKNVKNAGFTLIELLFIIVIMSALLSIVAPRVNEALIRARSRQCLANRVTIEHSAMRYMFSEEQLNPSIQQLRDSRYLNRYPVCSSNGTYFWVTNATSQDLYRIIGCSIHGWSIPVSTTNPNVVYISNFDDMNGIRTIQGGWGINSGMLNPATSGENQAMFNGETGPNYEISLNANLLSGWGYGLFFNATENPDHTVTGYSFQYDPMYYTLKGPGGDGISFVVKKFVNGNEIPSWDQAFMRLDFPIAEYPNIFNANHNVVIQAQNSNFTIKVDGQTMITFSDSSMPPGEVGFRTWNNSGVDFDNIVVTKQ